MITQVSQEDKFTLTYITTHGVPDKKQKIAFIGDYTACCMLIARAVKTHMIDYSYTITDHFILPHYISPIECYWLPADKLLFRDDTVSYVIVGDDGMSILDTRKEIINILKDNIGDGKFVEPIIQIAKANTASGISEEQRMLSATDWEVVKQLEILLLSDTELGKARAKLREMINSKK